MSERSPAPPTPLARRYVRYVLGFGVGVAVGLAPFLDRLDVPLFVPLLSVFPDSLRSTAVPLSSFVMGLVAVGIQFAAGERVPRRRIRRWFAIAFVAILAGLVVVAVLYTELVRVIPGVAEVEGERALNVPIVVGFSRPEPPLAGCGCEQRQDDVECIREIGFANVDKCWGRKVRRSELVLTLSYLFVTGSFGALIGLLLLQEGAPEKGRGRRR
jgi:hypothetical protein